MVISIVTMIMPVSNQSINRSTDLTINQQSDCTVNFRCWLMAYKYSWPKNKLKLQKLTTRNKKF